jgi:hypothetical protein
VDRPEKSLLKFGLNEEQLALLQQLIVELPFGVMKKLDF